MSDKVLIPTLDEIPDMMNGFFMPEMETVEEEAPREESYDLDRPLSWMSKDTFKALRDETVQKGEDLPSLPTAWYGGIGSFVLDMFYGGRGKGAKTGLYVMWGEPESAKTSISLVMAGALSTKLALWRAAHQGNGPEINKLMFPHLDPTRDHGVAFLNIEGTYDPSWARRLGVRENTLLVEQPNTVERCFKRLADYMASKDYTIPFVIWDTITDTPTQAEFDEKLEDWNQRFAYQARLLNDKLPTLKKRLQDNNMVLLMLAQRRANMDASMAKYYPDRLPGAMAMKHAASGIYQCQRPGSKQKEEMPDMDIVQLMFRIRAWGGQDVKQKASSKYNAQIVLNKSEQDNVFAYDYITDRLLAAAELGVIQNGKGGEYNFFTKDGKRSASDVMFHGEKLGSNSLDARDRLQKDKETFLYLEHEIMVKGGWING